MTTIFKIAYLILTFLSFNSFTARTSLLPYISVGITCLGAGIIVYRIWNIGNYAKTKYISLLILFLASGGISMLMNIKYGVASGVKGLIWMLMQYFILYASDYSVSPDKHRRNLNVFSVAAVVCTSIFNIVSFIMLFTNYEYKRLLGDLWIYGGIRWGRLWGMYTDPNFGAVISCVAIVLAVLLSKSASRIWVKGVLYFSVFVQASYIAFSDSRTGLVCIIAVTFCMVWFQFKRNSKKSANQLVKSAVGILIASCIALCVFVFEKGIVYGYNQLIISLSASDSNKSQESDIPGVIQRTDTTVTENNVSNGRFDIWKGGMKVFLRTPFIGTSFRNLTPYIESNMPELYNIDGRYYAFESMHNDFFDVLIGQGMIGFIIFMAFSVSCAIFIIKRLFKIKNNDQYEYIAMLFTAVVSMVIAMCFISCVVFINSTVAVLFWTLLGELMYEVHRTYALQQEDNIKVGILTEHRARNYGSCLQAIALKHAVEAQGYRTQIVDYRPSFIEDSFGIFIKDLYRDSKYRFKTLLSFLVKTVLRLPFSVAREINFYCFRERYMGLTFDAFINGEEDRIKNLKHKCYFLGSDQIWNPNITKGLCMFYFGDGLNKGAVKASYAASIGIKSLEGWEADFKEALKTVDFISVREQEAAELIRPITDKEVNIVLDPTLIVERDFWYHFTDGNKEKKTYIFVYALELNDELISKAAELSNVKKMPIVYFDLKNRYGIKAISKYSAGPQEFLSLLRNAEYVITNSFHGTVFSVIFERQFVCIPHGTTPGRMVNLLEKLDLTERLSYNTKDVLDIDRKIDFMKVHKTLNQQREESLKYLTEVLRECCNEQNEKPFI